MFCIGYVGLAGLAWLNATIMLLKTRRKTWVGHSIHDNNIVYIRITLVARCLCFFPSDPASITSPPKNSDALIDRERTREESDVLYVCVIEGYPQPTVTWYYNGDPIPFSSGINVSGNQLSISKPQVSHSGVYQCVAKNTHGRGESEETRAWFLEVRPRGMSFYLCVCVCVSTKIKSTAIRPQRLL